MWQAIAGILQIIFLILKNKIEKDEEVKKRREAMKGEAHEAIKSRDAGRINDIITRLRA